MNRPLPFPLTLADRRERAVRVAEIARRIDAGRYRVPAHDIADAVLAFHKRED